MFLPNIEKQIKNNKPELWELSSAIVENRVPKLHRDQVSRFFDDLNDIHMLEKTVKLLGCDEEIRTEKEKEIKIIEEELSFAKMKIDKDNLEKSLKNLQSEYYQLLFTILNDEDEISPLINKLLKDIKKGNQKINKIERDKDTINKLLEKWNLKLNDFKDKLLSLLNELGVDNYLIPENYNEDVEIEWDNKLISLTTTPLKSIFYVNDDDKKIIYAYQFELNGNIISIGSNTIYLIINNLDGINSMELTRLYKLLFEIDE